MRLKSTYKPRKNLGLFASLFASQLSFQLSTLSSLHGSVLLPPCIFPTSPSSLGCSPCCSLSRWDWWLLPLYFACYEYAKRNNLQNQITLHLTPPYSINLKFLMHKCFQNWIVLRMLGIRDCVPLRWYGIQKIDFF